MGLGTDIFSLKQNYGDKNELRASIRASKRKAGILPKEFDYYCPGCLHQTNEHSKRCPQCRKQRLLKTGKEALEEFISDDWYIEKNISKYFTIFMLTISIILSVIYLITWEIDALYSSIYWTIFTLIIDIFLIKIESSRKNMYINAFKANNYLVIKTIDSALKEKRIRYKKLGPPSWLTTFPIYFSETFNIFGQNLIIKVQRERWGYTLIMVGPVRQSNKKHIEDMKKILNIAFNDFE